ncbi:hypothetical protein AYM02_02775 [Coxiella burnetii]|uniref:Dot/Icm T4SS effector CoxH4 n=1 Tax=Coxiella burnetii TaxID=777 RepID=UPI0003A183DB|nr:Dot/Icm T4SS effector CoxH4 [Coxiella burnetii]AML48282.1 hypothetical protein AUR58_03120 [Coxiella burnetii]AML54296.1 hypothetical protein AYM38_02745 [Coxiella burnetii]ATN68261.1 hypothetical protein AYM00_02845 [Coxiella burnetii]ATN70188.1 hypothetical protein AYM02_02775 [Coxiella burnetii]ATN72133.1 hypothetical protein AYM11_02685 [Coxiella burnetii]
MPKLSNRDLQNLRDSSKWSEETINTIYKRLMELICNINNESKQEDDEQQELGELLRLENVNQQTVLIYLAMKDPTKLIVLVENLKESHSREFMYAIKQKGKMDHNVLSCLLLYHPGKFPELIRLFDDERNISELFSGICSVATYNLSKENFDVVSINKLEALFYCAPDQQSLIKAALEALINQISSPYYKIELLSQLITRTRSHRKQRLIENIYRDHLLSALLQVKKDVPSLVALSRLVSFSGKSYLKNLILSLKKAAPSNDEISYLSRLKSQTEGDEISLIYYIVNYGRNSGKVKKPGTTAISQLLFEPPKTSTKTSQKFKRFLNLFLPREKILEEKEMAEWPTNKRP